MEVYRVVLKIEGLTILNPGECISNKTKICYNPVEDFLELKRKEINQELLPRKGAIYVCKSLEQAHYWYNKINGCQPLNYFIYHLLLEGKVQWHNSIIYENLFSLFTKNPKVNLNTIRDKEMLAYNYWTNFISPSNPFAEGLFWGTAIVLNRMFYDKSKF